jgi:hypothetical protein
MALPSQMARPTVTRRVSFRSSGSRRRSRGPMRPLLAIVGLALLGLGVWAFWPKGKDEPAEPVVMVGKDKEPTGSTRRLPTGNDPAPRTESQPSRSAQATPTGREVRREQDRSNQASSNDPLAPGEAVFTAERTPQTAPSDQAGTIGGATGGTNGGVLPPTVPTGQPQGQPAPPPRPRTEAQAILAVAQRAIEENRLLDAREELNRALHAVDFTPAERDAFRTRLAEINETLFFSPTVAPGDPLVFSYTIKPSDVLINVVRRENSNVDWRFITRINKISDPSRIRVGQTLKLVRGPLHAVVHKSAFRMDLYADQTDGQGNRIYLRSFPVGLGEYDSTPIGRFVVRPNSKLIDPRWVNPRTGEAFASRDPKNPIGNRWIGLEGVDANTQTLSGYGIHGTIDPGSIGKMASMGCVRMHTPDVELVYEVLIERLSEVEVRP